MSYQRSTGLARGMAVDRIVSVIRARRSPTTVERITTSTGPLDEEQESSSTHTEDLWLHSSREFLSEEQAGERQRGSLGALAVADGTVDVQHGDRITYGGVEYEVDTVVGRPVDGEVGASPDTDYWDITLVRYN